MTYMLDTNICIYIMKNKSDKIKFDSETPDITIDIKNLSAC